MDAQPPAAPVPFLDRLGERALRRAEPRFGVALAGAGCALAVLGVVIIGLDSAFEGFADDGDGGGRVPGIVLSALAVGLGYLLLLRAPIGPLSTAGVAAAALGVPPLVFFLTFEDDSFPPYSAEAILLLSAAVWLITWLVGPGRGHGFFLGLALGAVWLLALEVTEDVFDSPFTFLGFMAFEFEESFDEPVVADDPSTFTEDDFTFEEDGFDFDFPDPTNIGVLSLVFGTAYVGGSRVLDRRGRAGAATAVLAAGIPALVVGIGSLTDDLDQAGTGVLLVLVGALLALHGATVGRRFTTWLGAAGVAWGVGAIVSDPVDDAPEVGVLVLLAGVGIVVVAALVAETWREPSELVPGPSTFDRPARTVRPLGEGDDQSGGSTQPSGPPPGPAGSDLG